MKARKPSPAKVRGAQAGALERPAGWYTAPVRAWFGPDWAPATVWGGDAVLLSQRARAGRARRVAQGDGGGIVGLSRNNDARLAALEPLPGAAPGRGRAA